MLRSKEDILLEQERLVRLHGMVKPQLLKYPNVDHIGVGVKEVNGELSDDLCYRVYVHEKKPLSALAAHERIPARILGVKTDVIEKGEVELMAADFERYRPLKGGGMIRSQRYEGEGKNVRGAGTVGMIVCKTGSAQLMALTCQHVVDDGVNSNIAGPFPVGIKVGQPRYITCCCCCTYNEFGNVFQAKKSATVDCALVQLAPEFMTALNGGNPVMTSNNAINTIVDLGVVTGVAQAVCWEHVRKRGAATLVTHGQVVDVLYEGSQLLIQPTAANPNAFADFGDSGAVIVNDSLQVVGLLWGAQRRVLATHRTTLPAGAIQANGVANHIGPVMTELGITIAGQGVGALAVPGVACGPSSSLSEIHGLGGSSSSVLASSSSSVLASSSSSVSSSSSSMGAVITLPTWVAWPGGKATTAMNPEETFTAADFGFAGNCDWHVGHGGVAGVIVETNSATANSRVNIRVRYDTTSPGITEAQAAWVECTKAGVTKRLRRTIFTVSTATINTSTAFHGNNLLSYTFSPGISDVANSQIAGFSNPGDHGATRYVGRQETRYEILPINIDWLNRGVRFRLSADGVAAPAGADAKGDFVSMRDNQFTDGRQLVGSPNRSISTQDWAQDGHRHALDCQYPSVANPNNVFAIDGPGFGRPGRMQGFFRDNFREFIRFHNGTRWVNITDYAYWFCNITAILPDAAPSVPSTVGGGLTAENLPNTRPVVVAGPNQAVGTGVLVTLTATATDADNDAIVRFRWRQVSGTPVVLSSLIAQNPTFVSPGAAATLVFEVIATDNTNVARFSPGTMDSLPSTVTITVA